MNNQVDRMTRSLLSVSLGHWPPQVWHNRYMNGVVIVGEMEVNHGPNSMVFYSRSLIWPQLLLIVYLPEAEVNAGPLMWQIPQEDQTVTQWQVGYIKTLSSYKVQRFVPTVIDIYSKYSFTFLTVA